MGDLAGLVGQDRLEAVPVVVGEGELRAGVRALAAHDHPRPSGQPVRSRWLVISETCPLGRALPSWSSAGTQALLG